MWKHVGICVSLHQTKEILSILSMQGTQLASRFSSLIVRLKQSQKEKSSFLGKHKLYVYKVELSVLPTGLCIACIKNHPVLVSDLEIFWQNHNFHEEASKKVISDLQFSDDGLLQHIQRDFWTILEDKEFQGAIEAFRVVLQKKQYRKILLSPLDQATNRQIASDDIITENYFGCLTSL